MGATVGELPTQDFPPDDQLRQPDLGATPRSAAFDETADAAAPATTAPAANPTADDAVRGTLTAEHPERYRLLDLLGEGGIGVVRCALDRHIGRDVAIKELRTDRARSRRREVRFVDEARITGQLEHPGIIPVYELGRRADGTIYYTMRRVRGDTLANALHGASLPDRLRLLPRLIDVCQAIAYAHSRGVVHRDLKPANVMVGEFGETLVLDWGLAKVRKPDATDSVAGATSSVRDAGAMATMDGQVMGTPAYMPPEQARGDILAIDARSDVYALGAILYEFLTGRPPYIGQSDHDVMLQVLEREIVPPRQREPNAPRELEAVAMRALARDPKDRYVDARAMVADLEAFEAGGLVAAHRYKLRDLLWRWVRRNAVIVGAIAVVLIGVAGAWRVRGEADRETHLQVETQRQALVMAEVERVLKLAASPRSAGWYDAWAYKLISLKEPAVEARLIAALANPSTSVVRLAVRALGGMGSHEAVPALMKLVAPDGLQNQASIVEVLRALGVIGDPAASRVIDAARRRYGQYSYVWQNTRLAAQMVPPPEIPLDRRSDANAWVDRGNLLMTRERFEDAFEHYNRAIGLDGKLARAYTNRGMVRRQFGDVAGSIKDHSAALAIDPDFPWALLNRAVSRRHAEDFAGAAADMDHLIGLKSGVLRASAFRSRAFLRVLSGDLTGAESDLDASLTLEPRNPRAMFGLARLAWARGNLSRSMSRITRTLEIDDSSLNFRWRAMLLRHSGDLKSALADLDRSVANEPGAERLLAARGAILLRQGRISAARTDFDRAVEIRPELAGPRMERATLFHARQGDYRAALADLDAALDVVGAEQQVSLSLMRYLVALRVPGLAVDAGSLKGNGQVPSMDRLVGVALGTRDPHPLAADVTTSDGWCLLRLAAMRWSHVTGRPHTLIAPQRGLVLQPAEPTEPSCGLLRAVLGVHWPAPAVNAAAVLPLPPVAD